MPRLVLLVALALTLSFHHPAAKEQVIRLVIDGLAGPVQPTSINKGDYRRRNVPATSSAPPGWIGYGPERYRPFHSSKEPLSPSMRAALQPVDIEVRLQANQFVWHGFATTSRRSRSHPWARCPGSGECPRRDSRDPRRSTACPRGRLARRIQGRRSGVPLSCSLIAQLVPSTGFARPLARVWSLRSVERPH